MQNNATDCFVVAATECHDGFSLLLINRQCLILSLKRPKIRCKSMGEYCVSKTAKNSRIITTNVELRLKVKT